MRTRKHASLVKSDDFDYDVKEKEKLIEEVTKVVDHFLTKKSRMFRGWFISNIVCDSYYIIFELDGSKSQNFNIKNKHFEEVSNNLHGAFKLIVSAQNNRLYKSWSTG